MKQLNISKWHHKILNAPVYFLEITGFTREQDLVSEYIGRREIESQSVNQIIKEKVSDCSARVKTGISDIIENDLQNAVAILSRQMIVLAATYIEAILSEFLASIFQNKPERMYDFLVLGDSEKGKGNVALREILAATTKEELIEHLSNRAVNQAITGKFTKIISRIKKVSSCEIDESLGEVIGLRNKIVHEAIEPIISEDEVVPVFSNIENMLFKIGKSALENGIEVDDELGLLEEDRF